MSFNSNDNEMIHLGNYEEFFILYVDNELNEDQAGMVDDFLLAHPDLKAELEILMSTKLPAEEFSFDKTELLSDKMKFTSVDEELLLYIDNELPADKKTIIELELASNKDYKDQQRLLLKTKLDPSEIIAYPNKKELYRRTEHVIAFKAWLRVAAAIVIIALGGFLYFNNKPSSTTLPGSSGIANAGVTKPQKQNTIDPVNSTPVTSQYISKATKVVDRVNKPVETIRKREGNVQVKNPEEQPQLDFSKATQDNDDIAERKKVSNLQLEGDRVNTYGSSDDPKVSLNTSSVTSSSVVRTTNSSTAEQSEGSVAKSNRKDGSVRGFLRKATRMIEKRTGIDPTNDNGELLIGAVAISLK